MDVSPERLQHFFVKENDRYRIKKELREMVLFAPHNVLRDPPFSRLDLISYRNLLIYLNRAMQERILGNFHFWIALRRLPVPGRVRVGGNHASVIHPVGQEAACIHPAPDYRSSPTRA